MAILNQPPKDFVRPVMVALTPMALYLERVNSISEGLRDSSDGFDYIPMQFGGIKGQQESLSANSVVKVINFKVTSNDQ
jgi:hypothetical protein